MIAPARPKRGLCDLFARDDVSEFVETVSQASNLSVLAGAGTSIESGFPDWTTLVERLLVCVAEDRDLSADASKGFADWTIKREGLTAAAAVAETALGDRFLTELHRALYVQQLTPPPAQTALGIARLARSFGFENCDISTTNYDLLLEAAIDSTGGTRSVVATGPATRSPNRVLHLHGVVKPRGGIQGDLILSERDYFLMQEDAAWQQKYFAERLQKSSCLFIGASLTDPNLLRYLYRSTSSSEHWAVFVRQQDADIYDEADAKVVALREETSEGRWMLAGIRPLHADYFSQSAQLLHEVLYWRTAKAARRRYIPLPKRLVTWRRRVDEGVLTTQPGRFAKVQDALQGMLNDLLAGIRADLADAGHRTRPGERLGLSVWVYDPQTESLTNWASSDRVWRDPATMEPLPIDWTSDFVSIKAFCAGSLVSRSTEQYAATRWNHVIGSPLYLETERLGRLPVGAVTIASTSMAPGSALNRGIGTLRRTSLPTVEAVLTELLQPDTVAPGR